MVFLTSPLSRLVTFVKKYKTPDSFWKKRQILKLSAHFRHRRQNIYRFALVGVRRAFRSQTQARDRKKKEFHQLFTTRLSAACEEHGFEYKYFKESLIRSNVLLNTRILADLAIWEPRTFKCLTDFAWKKASDEGLAGVNKLGDPPSGVILKTMIIK